MKTATLIDIPMAEMDDQCGMKMWYARLEGGTGIAHEEDKVREAMAGQIHQDLRTISMLPDLRAQALQEMVDDVLSALTPEDKKNQRRMEILYRRLGLAVAFALYKEPTIRERYVDMAVDKEVVLDREQLWVITTPDRVMKSKATKDIIYGEYTTFPSESTTKKWIMGWQYKIGPQLGMAAVAEDLHCKVNYGLMMGLGEGFRSVLDGRLVHPYVWAFRNERDEWATGRPSISGDWKQAPVWEFKGGLVQWVKTCGEGVANSQFVLSSPIAPNKAMLDAWVARRIHREREVNLMQTVCQTNHFLRGNHFERRGSMCRPPTGEACPYINACWDALVRSAPLKSGEYVRNNGFAEVAQEEAVN